MKTKRKAEILYRKSRYGSWQPCSINIPDETVDIKKYCEEDLAKMNIQFTQIQIVKTVKK